MSVRDLISSISRRMGFASAWEPGLSATDADPAWAAALAASDPAERWFTGPMRPRFVGRSGGALPVPAWPAYRALVVDMHATPGHEGPDYRIDLVFPHSGRWSRFRMQFGYDTTHWRISSPEHFGWFEARLSKVGETVTVLCDGSSAVVFGHLEPFVELELSSILDFARTSPKPAEREAWLNEALDLLNGDREKPGHEARVVDVAFHLGTAPERLVPELSRRLQFGESTLPWLDALVPGFAGITRRVWAAD